MKYAIFHMSQQGTLTLALPQLFDTPEVATDALHTTVVPNWDNSQRQALHMDLRRDSIGDSPNKEVLDNIRAKFKEDPDVTISLNTTNLVILPVQDIVTLDFTINRHTFAALAESPDIPENLLPANQAANDAQEPAEVADPNEGAETV